ncbi:hypothetical protein [Nitrosopumilus sp.]|uniref:hypothetical protein n=1 Tax=Nitrosopumilus sp. TaxID=2024843 RepID=UPI00247E98B8|nr:hypothetical protein [Nitrosopumilus sp.]MCV0409929.1 hypothetical protein [Nitrosopumilus sp.]
MFKPGKSENKKKQELPKDQMKKALISFVIEQSLIDEGGIKVFEKTMDLLRKKFGCDTSECLHHPDYLIQILNDLPKKAHEKIILAIEEKLKEFEYQEEVRKFTKNLCRIDKVS